MSNTPSAALVLVELRLPAFQRGTAVQGARGLTVHPSNSHLPCQTLVPSAARQPGSRRLPGQSLAAQPTMTSLVRTVRRSTNRHRPIALTTDRKSKDRSVINNPRNSGRFLGNAVSRGPAYGRLRAASARTAGTARLSDLLVLFVHTKRTPPPARANLNDRLKREAAPQGPQITLSPSSSRYRPSPYQSRWPPKAPQATDTPTN